MSTDSPPDDMVQLDAATIQKIGVRTTWAKIEPLAHEVRATGRFVMDEQAEHTITLKTSGYIENLTADYNGMKINKGDHLFDVYSPDLLASQEEFLQAAGYVNELLASQASSENLAQAQRILDASRKRLQLWDLSEDVISSIEESGRARRLVSFYAPVSGEIMRKHVTEGAFVEAGEHLVDIIDISQTWLIVDVFESDLPWIGVGTPARVELPYDPSFTFEGEIEHIYHMINEDLRAIRARIVLPSGHQSPFKPGMFATVYLKGRPDSELPIVPSEALVRDGRRELVILSEGDGKFRPVPVRSGRESDGWIQILEGLDGDEEVVVSAQFLIDSEARLGSAVMAMQNMDM